MFKCTYRNRKISFEGIKLIYEQQLWQVLPESMIILLCAINIEEIQLLKMLTIIFDEYFHILPYFLFYLWKLFSKNKKGKVNGCRLLFLRHSMNIVVKKYLREEWLYNLLWLHFHFTYLLWIENEIYRFWLLFSYIFSFMI